MLIFAESLDVSAQSMPQKLNVWRMEDQDFGDQVYVSFQILFRIINQIIKNKTNI
jgi:hypothetical protein